MLRKAWRTYWLLVAAETVFLAVYAARGGDPSTCAHPSIRCGGDDPQAVIW